MISTHLEFLMYVLGAAFCQQIQMHRIRCMVFSVIEFNDGKYLAVPALIAITEAEKQTEGTRLDGTCGNLKPGREKNGASNKILKPLDQVKVKNRHLPLLRKKE